jgi:hypothetical protein
LPTQSTVKTPLNRKLSNKDLNTPQNKIEKKENNQTLMKRNQASFANSVTFRSFSLKIPKWGGSIELNASDLFFFNFFKFYSVLIKKSKKFIKIKKKNHFRVNIALLKVFFLILRLLLAQLNDASVNPWDF